jgi:ubiquinone biosynthesis protein
MALEELGVTYIKLGQILSTRSDLLPPDYLAELSRLQDAVPPEPWPSIERQIAQELGGLPTDIFAEFDQEPLGSASIGQVHSARLKTGEQVVVKVQRPKVARVVEEDLAILMDLAKLAENRTSWGKVYNFPALAEEFATTLKGELDYFREGRNADLFRQNFKDSHLLRIPKIYWDYTTRRVLTMERLDGVKISDLQSYEAAEIDKPALARRAARVVFKMVLEDGFFHADPHPGNFVIMEGNVIGLLDHGMVGQLDDPTRETLLRLLLSIANQDLDRVVDQLVALGITGSNVQMERLRHDLGHLLSLYWNIPLKEIDVSQILDEAMAITRRHHLQLPSNLAMLIKTMAMNEGLARSLDPDFSAADVLRPYVLQLTWERLQPHYWGKKLFPTLFDLSELAVSLPRRVDRLLTRMERGNLTVNMNLQDTDRLLNTLNGVVNRLILALLASSFAVAIALLLQTYFITGSPWPLGWILGLGLTVVVALGFWLILSILTPGQR